MAAARTGGRTRPSLRRGGAAGLAAAALALPAAPALGAGAPPPPPGWKPGWLAPPSAYVGRYDLTSSAGAHGARNAGVEGQLTLFLQVAFAGKPPVPAGIIALRTKSQSEIFYLTLLDHDGAQRVSEVHGGAFVAPATGRFTVSTLRDGVVVGTLAQRGLATQTLSFRRFSTNPQP